MLDIFSGTGSVAKVHRDHGYEVITLDSDPRFKADIQTDILEWDPRSYPRDTSIPSLQHPHAPSTPLR